jgi:hypothetical protein
MASHNRRGSSVDRASVQSILTSGAQPQSPSPHGGTSLNREHFAMHPPPPRSTVKHTRALSYAPRRPNRLSISFPVAPSNSNSDTTRPTPTSSIASSFPASPADSTPALSPNDASGFLVALAGQERRILELKEELQKAESDLAQLKLQRAEIRHVEKLQPLPTVVTDERRSSEELGGSTRQSVELDRRKALLSNIAKEPRRKVITGGHTRTLSLLSPDRSNFTHPFVPRRESESKEIPRSATMPSTNQGMTKISTSRARHSYQGGVTHNAKQIAEDVKAGLWTFLEEYGSLCP